MAPPFNFRDNIRYMRLLIVEDEKKLAQSLKKALETESYAVDICFDGETALEQALFEDYDVIILDLGLPKLDGIQLCKQLRSEKVTTPILILTARDAQKNKIEGFNVGADDYLVKPFDFNELLVRIKALVRRGAVSPETIYKIDSLELNTTTKLVTRCGKEIKLSAKEYGLLEYLAANKNKVIAKSRLLEHVWDSATDPFSNVIDVYIGYIRNKIDKDFPKEKALVTTLKGLGYSLKE